MKLFIVADMEGAIGNTHRDRLGDAGGLLPACPPSSEAGRLPEPSPEA